MTSSHAREVDPRFVRALTRQLERRRRALRDGAAAVGWKLGQGDSERIGGEMAVGHLTSETCLPAGAVFLPDEPGADLHADAEVAVELGRDLEADADTAAARDAIRAYAVALEICDLRRPSDDPEDIVTSNAFHRAVAFGPFGPRLPRQTVTARLIVNGDTRGADETDVELAPRVSAAARLLGAVGERLREGDRIITGLVVQVPLDPGDHVVADMGPLGRVSLSIGTAGPARRTDRG